MIQANELRIGNAFEYHTEEGWMLNIIDVGDITMCFADNEYFNDNYRPVELTEEILLKCGFSSPVNGWYTSPNGNLEFGFNRDGKLILMDWFLEITSLHQLQNLYFVLTNTELEINL